MKDKYEYLRQMIKKNSISGNTTNEYMWTLCYVNYFYYNGNIGPRDIKNHWTDERADGGIDYVYYDDNHEEIYLIQGKSEKNLTIDDIKFHIQKMYNTIEVFEQGKENQYKLNKKIIKAYQKGMSTRKKKNIKLVLITETPIIGSLKEKVDFWKNNLFTEYEVIIYGRDEIHEQEANVASGEKTVEKGFLECADENKLEYSNEKNSGVILNIKANSLKELYQKEEDNGLFGYNLREYITKNKLEVDDGIKSTIEKEKDNFWFYNNGITIACDNYSIRNNKIYLHNFSVINGAQTTTLIGKSTDINSDRDFSIVCKIVKSPNSLDNEFVKQISKSSNSQKEIETRDLYSNAIEQIQLQYKFRINQYPLAVTIKRGVKPKNYNDVKEWQRIDNSKLGQLILSALLQKPGTARNMPKCIFSDKDIYESIFNIKKVANYNYNALYDIVRLQTLYEKYKKKAIEEKESKRKSIKRPAKYYDKIMELQNNIGVLKNSGFTAVSIVMYLVKRKYFNLPKINGSKDTEWKKFVNTNIDTDLSLSYKYQDHRKNMDLIYEGIINKLFELYDKEIKDPNSTVNSPSNYFKSDDIYRKKIIPAFDELLEKHPDDIIFKKLEMFNDENIQES